MASKKQFFLFSILLSMIGTKALAADIEVKNADGMTIYYNYINDGKELEVTQSSYSVGSGYRGSLVIPDEVTYNGITRKVTSIGESAFSYCRDLTSVSIPNSVMSIEKNAFYRCSGLTSVTIPNSVTSIGAYAFMHCSDLISITIGNSVTSIGEEAFSHCSALVSVTIPNSVTSIGNTAFYRCSGLTSVTIPNSVTSIGDYVFYGCDIPEVISKIENPFSIHTNTFSDNTYNNATLYVPVGTIDKYKATEGWKKFAFIEEGNGGGDTPPSKCEKPTITFKDGKLTFSCATEGVTYQYSITAFDVKNGVGNDIDFAPKYTITAYATKAGYENSETATLEISVNGGVNGDVNNDGTVDAADVVKLANIIMGE